MLGNHRSKKDLENVSTNDARLAVLVDCDNVSPDILAYALYVTEHFGHVTIRRGYGNQDTQANKNWQNTLMRLAFTPCLQYQYASGKNTADIALALDAMESLFERRANTFCLVTSDSDFTYLSRKLCEHGATVCIIGEAKTPDALRNAGDYFFEWPPRNASKKAAGGAKAIARTAVAPTEAAVATAPKTAAPPAAPIKTASSKAASKVTPKSSPRFIIDAVSLLAAEAPERKIDVGKLGQHLRDVQPDFSPKAYGHAGLLIMLRTYDLLELEKKDTEGWTVSLDS